MIVSDGSAADFPDGDSRTDGSSGSGDPQRFDCDRPVLWADGTDFYQGDERSGRLGRRGGYAAAGSWYSFLFPYDGSRRYQAFVYDWRISGFPIFFAMHFLVNSLWWSSFSRTDHKKKQSLFASFLFQDLCRVICKNKTMEFLSVRER